MGRIVIACYRPKPEIVFGIHSHLYLATSKGPEVERLPDRAPTCSTSAKRPYFQPT